MRIPIEPDRAHHAALTALGLRHVSSTRVTGERLASGTFHSYEGTVGYSRRWDESTWSMSTNGVRRRMIDGVVQHFRALGYTHVASRGRQGIHWFGRRGPHDVERFLAAKVGARMDTKHGRVWVSIHDYRTPQDLEMQQMEVADAS